MARRRKHRGFGILMKISEGAYKKALAKVQADRRVVARYRDKKSGWSSVPAGKSKATNRDRAVVEIYRFQHRKKATPFVGYLSERGITNWTGLKICTILRRKSGRRVTPTSQGWIEGKQQSVRAKCIDGHTYVGRGQGDGMYIKLRPVKG